MMDRKSVRVEVTEDDIARGGRKNAKNCPIALALKRTGWKRPHVADDEIWDDYYCDAAYATTKKAVRFMERFDAGKPVEPTRFLFRAMD